MATSPNYSWPEPDNTSLVKDGALAIRNLGDAIDTTTKALNPSTTLGDIEYRSATANTNTRLPIGSNGNVLTVTAGVPAWAAPAGGGTGMTLISAITTTGVSTIQVTGLGSYDRIVILAQWTPTSAAFGRVRLNNNSSSVYRTKQSRIFRNSSGDLITQNHMELLAFNDAMIGFSTAASSTSGGSGGGSNPTSNYRIDVNGLKSTTGFKTFEATQQLWNGSLDLFYQNTGIFESTTAVTTLDFVLSAGNFGATDIRVYGA
jgi:hypothetical protein